VEVYTLDRLFRRIAVIDQFQSLIWTDRWSTYGDFELVVHDTKALRRLFPTGTRLAMNDSDRVMTVETVEKSRDSEGRSILTVKGRSLEQILEDRVATQGLQGLEGANETWDVTGTPAFVEGISMKNLCRKG
jgi:hypothetical protein